jgi:3-dehydroquinate dehydratase-1
MNILAEMLDRPEPTVAVSFTEPLEGEDVRRIVEFVDIAELRADRYPSQNPGYLIQQAGKLEVLPRLLTIRSSTEGGEWTGGENERLHLYTAVMSHVEGIDIELAAPIMPELVESAHTEDKIVIASRHDFLRTPPVSELWDSLEDSRDKGADYTKFACIVRTLVDFQRLAEFTLDNKDDDVIVVAMDDPGSSSRDYGPLSRIMFPALGSRLTYAFAGEVPVARGQMSYTQTYELIHTLYPQKIFK